MSLNSVQSFVIENCNGPTIENGLNNVCLHPLSRTFTCTFRPSKLFKLFICHLFILKQNQNLKAVESTAKRHQLVNINIFKAQNRYDKRTVPTLVGKVWKNIIMFSRLKKFEKNVIFYMLVWKMKTSFQT